MEQLDGYARACSAIAEQDLEYVLAAPSKDAAMEIVVVGNVLGDAALAVVRRLARREASSRRDQNDC
ncbi:hypothetical protein ACQPZF_09790 [Actinosynnema sp. CS-041913]|uniref:hypothetical protein n=1 Tax=Actinosynnema sp. CS-041913 TaxID=3239917 RepID=UPI003D8B71D8